MSFGSKVPRPAQEIVLVLILSVHLLYRSAGSGSIAATAPAVDRENKAQQQTAAELPPAKGMFEESPTVTNQLLVSRKEIVY